MIVVKKLWRRLPAAGKKSREICRDYCWNYGYDLPFLKQNKREVLCGVHTRSEKFENAALFLWLGQPSSLIRHENEVFRKRSSNRRKNASFYSDVTIITWFPSNRVFLKHKSKMTGVCCVSKFLRGSVHEKRSVIGNEDPYTSDLAVREDAGI